MTHTPTPYYLDEQWNIKSGDKVVATVNAHIGKFEALPNANMIIKAVNCHNELVEALKYAKHTLWEAVALGCSTKNNSIGLSITTIEQALKKVDEYDTQKGLVSHEK